MELIRVQNLHKTYRLGDVALAILKGVSFAVERGELVALVGASGSGKTTLMNVLGCLDRPTSGQYWFDGREVSGLSNDERARLRNSKMGFVFQNYNLLARTSALENVALPLLYSNTCMSERKANARARELLCSVGLEDRMTHDPSRLSGGQQQRVAIARALVNQPELLLADEPTGNLDSTTGEEILALFQHLNRAEGITILLVTHDAHVVAHAGRAIHIRDGAIVDGQPMAGQPSPPQSFPQTIPPGEARPTS